MPQVGPMELLVIAAVALIVFGPEKLPVIARQVGRYAAELRRMANDVRDEFESGLALDEDERFAVPEESYEAPSAEGEDDEPDEPDEPAKEKPADPDETEH